MYDHDPQPWQCDECGRSNPWHVTMCQGEFWYPAEPAPDLSQWLIVSIQDQEEESRERWSNAQPCPQCGTPMLYQDELVRGLCPMCWSKNRKEQEG